MFIVHACSSHPRGSVCTIRSKEYTDYGSTHFLKPLDEATGVATVATYSHHAGVSGLIVSFQVYFEMMYIILIRHESSSSNIINMESGLPATRIKPNNKKLLGNWRDRKGRAAHAATYLSC